MERQILHVFAGDLRDAGRPSTVPPRDQLDGWICRSHRFRKLDGLARRGVEIEAVLVVGSLVANLPEPDAQRGCMAMSLAIAVVGIVAVRDPRGCFSGVGRTHLATNLHVLSAAVRLEVDADERLRVDSPAQVDELDGPDLIRLDSTPQQVEHRWSVLPRADAFPPPIEVRKDSAPAHHRRAEFAGDRHDILTPIVAQMVPGGLD